MKRVARWTALIAFVLGIGAIIDGCASFGSRPTRADVERFAQSPEWHDGKFNNPQPIVNDIGGMLKAFLHSHPDTRGSNIPVVHPDVRTLPASGLRVTWLGHSSSLVEIDGTRVLTDPMWSYRVSPIHGIGPTRWYPPPLPLDELPPIDAVVISHDHYDHLDMRTIIALRDRVQLFFVPLGVAANLEGWGIPRDKIVELDWWEEGHVGALRVTCVPARHASGRTLTDRDHTLWSGWALRGPQHRVYYSGDSGLFPAIREIGDRLGPFDITMIEVGQYHRSWPDWHMGPEQAVRAHRLVRGGLFIPVHWGLFTLAMHPWTEPADRAIAAAQAAHVSIAVPRPGQSVDIAAPAPLERWWPNILGMTGAEDPIRSSQLGDLPP